MGLAKRAVAVIKAVFKKITLDKRLSSPVITSKIRDLLSTLQ